MRRPLVVAALTAGLVAGTVVAATRPDAAAPRGAGSGVRPITAAPARPPVGRLPDGRYDAGYSHFIVQPGSLRVATTIEDPGGEPAWAIRAYEGERRTIRRPSRTLDDYAYRQAYRCVQLGRVMDGAFGWVYADRRFRPSEPGQQDQLTACTSRKRPREIHYHATVAVFPAPSDPRIYRSAVWGFAPPGARSVAIVGAPSGPQEVPLHGGAFVALTDPSLPRGALRLRFGLANGDTEVTRVDRVPRLPRMLRTGQSVPGTERIEARAPDPAGGPGWGVEVSDRRGGGVCVGGAGQVVGNQAGGVDTDYGVVTTYAARPGNCRRPGEGPTRKKPLWIEYGGGSGDPRTPDPLLRRARIERRVLPGRFEIVAECHPSVERVTIRSPRDIRTLVPSERGHVVFALYDGFFPAGKLVVTAHLRGGSTYSERFHLVF